MCGPKIPHTQSVCQLKSFNCTKIFNFFIETPFKCFLNANVNTYYLFIYIILTSNYKLNANNGHELYIELYCSRKLSVLTIQNFPPRSSFYQRLA